MEMMSTKSDVSKDLLSFLKNSNRPYAINDILTKSGLEISKGALQKALEKLVANDKITAKTFGKIVIYFIKQNRDLKELQLEIRRDGQKLAQAQNLLRQKSEEYRELELKLRALKQIRSRESLEIERNQLLDDIRGINERLSQHEIMAKESKLTNADVKRIESQYELVTGAYRKRKRICNDMLDAILEGYPKSKKALIDDIGIETDESVNFTVNIKR